VAALEPTGVPTIRLAPDLHCAADEMSPLGCASSEESEAVQNESQEAKPLPPEAAAPGAGQPLAIGALLAGRFEIVEIVAQSPEQNAYRARDWGRCASCGYEGNVPEDRFCLDCGAALDAPLYATISERPASSQATWDFALSENGRDYGVVLEPAPASVAVPSQPPDMPAPRLVLRWGLATDAGLARERNEDYADCWTLCHADGPRLGFFVVADGLGGADSGEVASALAVRTAWAVVREHVVEPVLRGQVPTREAVLAALTAAVAEANRAVYEARSAASSEMSTTLTMALVVDRHATIANVGDSRTYLCDTRGLERITRDHSLVQRLVDAGTISPAQVYAHPQRNLILQSVGDRPEVEADLFERDLQPDDRLLLCSDGLWESVRDEGIEETLLAEQEPQRACDALVRYANLAGGDDNISVIVVQALEDPAAPRG